MLAKDQMDIKRKLSPHLGDDLKIRIYFGEIKHQPSSPPTSPLSLHTPPPQSSLNDDENGQSIELAVTNKTNGKYQEISRAEEL